MNVQKMTGLELAKIEADETHPLHAQACDEIDRRNEDVTGSKSEVGLSDYMDEPYPDYDEMDYDPFDPNDSWWYPEDEHQAYNPAVAASVTRVGQEVVVKTIGELLRSQLPA